MIPNDPVERVVLNVTPAAGLIDQPLCIRMDGLPGNSFVTLRASLVDARGAPWTSHATYLADSQGSVDVSTDAPVSGTYSGVDPDGS
jgi:hypothetical protein